MRAVIRGFHSPDVDDLDSWRPADPRCFGFLLQVLVGPSDGPGAESFDFVVCSLEWLRSNYGGDGLVFGRHHVLLFEYDFDRVRKAIEGIVSKASGSDWSEVASKIARYGKWELEDYREPVRPE